MNGFKIVLFGIFLLAWTHSVLAQDPEISHQQWNAFTFDYVFKGGELLSTAVEYNQLVSGNDSDWNELLLIPEVHISTLNWLDLVPGVTFAYTHQFTDTNTFEIRPTLGALFRITPHRRFYFRNYLRIEYRQIFYSHTGDNSGSGRLRNRVELKASITQPKYSDNKNLYALTDFEIFYNLGEEPQERYLYRYRWRIGLGYRFNNKWRIQGLYMLQESRNSFERDGIDNIDNIYQIGAIWFINPTVEE